MLYRLYGKKLWLFVQRLYLNSLTPVKGSKFFETAV